MKQLVLITTLLLAPVSFGQPAAAFLDSCSGCHTVGGGELTGPDLTAATSWSRTELHAAVRRMQDFAGPLTAQQIDEITDLLASPAVRDLIAEEVQRRGAPAKPAFPDKGRRLFFGEENLTNGGVACFACHTVAGRGGNLAADLTRVHERMGGTPLIAAAEKPTFPLMKATYAAHPLTAQEALDLAAFFKEAAAAREQAIPEGTGALHGAAAGVAAALLGIVVFAFRSRR